MSISLWLLIISGQTTFFFSFCLNNIIRLLSFLVRCCFWSLDRCRLYCRCGKYSLSQSLSWSNWTLFGSDWKSNWSLWCNLCQSRYSLRPFKKTSRVHCKSKLIISFLGYKYTLHTITHYHLFDFWEKNFLLCAGGPLQLWLEQSTTHWRTSLFFHWISWKIHTSRTQRSHWSVLYSE